SWRTGVLAVALAIGVATLVTATANPQAPAAAPHTRPATGTSLTDVLDRAFTAAYNLDHPEAVQLARTAVVMAPDDPLAHRALAAILWLDMLFQRGAVTVDNYLGSSSKAPLNLPKPAPDVDAEFKKELALATQLVEAQLKKNPHDLDAKFEAGSVYA